MKQPPKDSLNLDKSKVDHSFFDNNPEIFDAGLLSKIALGFEATNAVIVAILLTFAWFFEDPQSLIIPLVMGLIGMPLIDISRRNFSRGLINEGVFTASLVSWLTALVIGFFASIVPVIFAVSAVISFVPAIVAGPTVPSRLLLLITGISTLICGVCSLFLVMPAFLPEGVPAEVIGRLIAVVVPFILCLLSVVLWYGHNCLQLSLSKAQKVNKALAEQHRLEKELEHRHYLEKQAQLNAERASLESLRYQLNPHFLFNSLASIRGAIHEETEIAHEMVTALSEFCRLSLTHGAIDILSLKDEFKAVSLYLKMEQIRSGNGLQLELSIPKSLENFMMPAFLLQPIIENSIKYGRRTSPEPLIIELKIQPIQKLPSMVKAENRSNVNGLHIRVSNSGTWVDEEEKPTSYSTGTGLRNLRQRLYKFYGELAQLTHRESDNRVHIEVWLPFELKTVP